jgi:glycosyltransferase involved in cell wall biosynthesis
MRIAICAAQVPFAWGGAEIHVAGLHSALERAGHDVATISLPFKWYPQTSLLKSALAWRMVDITEAEGQPIDLAICTKFPTWAVRHPNKIAWVIHQYRQAYDWFGTEWSDLSGTPEDLALRRRIQHIDARGLGECYKRFTNSRNTANRLKKFNGLDAEPLYVPVRLKGLQPLAREDFILSVARLDQTKRIDILINAINYSSSKPHVVIVGGGPERDKLEQLVEHWELQNNVTFLGRVSDERVVELYNRCQAVYYGPIDEDFGLATLEAFTAGKPVITTPDSGGVLELVRHLETGLIADDPAPAAISEVLDFAQENSQLCESMGMAGKAIADTITWDRVVDRLLSGTHG